jgi:glycosyltransferase involved in cell wall biosynthesis
MNKIDAVSLIVPVYNGGRNWTRVLDALSALDPAPREILIADDGSTDDSVRMARERGFRVLQTPKPRSGPAVARNLAAAHAQGAILFFIDADVLVCPDAVARVTRLMANENIDALFGAYDDAPADAAFVSQYKNLLHHYVHQHSRAQATTFWAGCGAIRREAFRSLGGFSTAYARPSIEDIELGNRLARAGGTILLAHALQVKHLKRWTLRALLVTDIRDRALPWAELIARQGKLPSDLNLQASHRLSALLCWLLLACIPALVFAPIVWLAFGVILVALLALNFDLYRFMFQKRGVWFTLRALPLHWLYYLYSSAAFAYVMLKNARAEKRRTSAQTFFSDSNV